MTAELSEVNSTRSNGQSYKPFGGSDARQAYLTSYQRKLFNPEGFHITDTGLCYTSRLNLVFHNGYYLNTQFTISRFTETHMIHGLSSGSEIYKQLLVDLGSRFNANAQILRQIRGL